MDAVDRRIVNALQDGIGASERPFLAPARDLGMAEGELLKRVQAMLDERTLSRFGPMYDAERMGGAFALAAMAVPEDRFDAVAAQVNARPEVAHNYARAHALNMWFVVAAETPDGVDRTIAAIAAETGIEVLALPKEAEYFVGLRFAL